MEIDARGGSRGLRIGRLRNILKSFVLFFTSPLNLIAAADDRRIEKG